MIRDQLDLLKDDYSTLEEYELSESSRILLEEHQEKYSDGGRPRWLRELHSDIEPLEYEDDELIDLSHIEDKRDPNRLAPVDSDLLPAIDPRNIHVDWIACSFRGPPGIENQFCGDVQELWRDNRKLIKRKILSTWKEHSSWSAKVQVRVNGGTVQISGNLNKWLHGQALFGISHPFDLVCAFCEDYRQETGINIRPVSPFDVRISRIDLTGHINFESVKSADQFLSSMRYVLRARLPGEVMPGEVVQYRNTVYWGQHSRAWTLKIYNKLRELRRHWAKGLETLNYWEVPESVLRIELTLRGPQLIRFWANLRHVGTANLERKGWAQWSWSKTLACAGSWNEMKCLGAFMFFVRGRIHAFENYGEIPHKEMNWKDVGVFRSWIAGDPLRQTMPKNTWIRTRDRFRKEYNIDLERPPNPNATSESSSVVMDGLNKLRNGHFYVFSPKHAEKREISNT